MKNSFFITTILFSLMVGCSDRVDTDVIEQVPDDIIPTKTCPTLYARILELFPEFQNNESKQSVLFSDTVQKNVTLTRDTEVYVTFISEGASLHNTFGWYSYNALTPPQDKKDIELHVLFPDVFNQILNRGDRLKLGNGAFKQGTVIGFFLIIGGWQSGAIDFTKVTHYTDYSFNGEKQQQHILFEEKTCGDIVLAFEDNPLNQPNCDRDFNDIIFTVSDNNADLKNTSFGQSRLVKW